MSQISSFISCPDIQRNLNGYFGQNPQLLVEPIVLTTFLNSQMNQVDGLEITLKDIVSTGGGKKRTAQLTYTPRFLESGVDVGSGRDSCTSSNIIGETAQLYDIEDTDYIQADFSMNYFDLIRRCESNQEYFSRTLQMLIDQVTRARETILYTDMATMGGAFSVNEPDVTDNVKDIATAYANGTLDPKGIANIVTATRYAGYMTGPIIFGGRQMGIYINELESGCCSIDGVNVAELYARYGRVFLESYRADNAFGADGFFTVAPGALQMLEWSEYEGTSGSFNFIDSDLLKQMVIIDPRTGLKYDFKMVIDCNGIASIFIRSWFKLVNLPADAFYSGDRLFGVNWINEFNINNPS